MLNETIFHRDEAIKNSAVNVYRCIYSAKPRAVYGVPRSDPDDCDRYASNERKVLYHIRVKVKPRATV